MVNELRRFGLVRVVLGTSADAYTIHCTTWFGEHIMHITYNLPTENMAFAWHKHKVIHGLYPGYTWSGSHWIPDHVHQQRRYGILLCIASKERFCWEVSTEPELQLRLSRISTHSSYAINTPFTRAKRVVGRLRILIFCCFVLKGTYIEIIADCTFCN